MAAVGGRGKKSCSPQFLQAHGGILTPFAGPLPDPNVSRLRGVCHARGGLISMWWSETTNVTGLQAGRTPRLGITPLVHASAQDGKNR